MESVKKIIELMRGGLDGLKDNAIKLEVSGFMPLSIELIGTGPRNLPCVSVMHWFVQNGDLMRDPDVEFEIDEAGNWHPISYRQDSLGLMQEAVFVDDDSRRTPGKVMVRLGLVKDLKKFAKLWDRNLKDQGFIAAAEAVPKA